jgi:hypothetical protein
MKCRAVIRDTLIDSDRIGISMGLLVSKISTLAFDLEFK